MSLVRPFSPLMYKSRGRARDTHQNGMLLRRYMRGQMLQIIRGECSSLDEHMTRTSFQNSLKGRDFRLQDKRGAPPTLVNKCGNTPAKQSENAKASTAPRFQLRGQRIHASSLNQQIFYQLHEDRGADQHGVLIDRERGVVMGPLACSLTLRGGADKEETPLDAGYGDARERSGSLQEEGKVFGGHGGDASNAVFGHHAGCRLLHSLGGLQNVGVGPRWRHPAVRSQLSPHPAPLVQAECPGGNPTGRPSALLWRHSWHWRRWGFVCDVRHVMRRDVQAGPRRR
mmetsp:Transcript_87677/g.281427  ORF Transcript_87677/g.281427 Transcript_87677/m.281427 type:complete len:284 (-) Transcript_87677:5-856(-)